MEKDEFMKELFSKYKPEKDNLIQMLNEVQEHFGYVPQDAQMELSEFLKIPMAEIYGVITFYSRFTLKPKGEINISICLGTACYVKGSQKLLDRAKERLGIEPGQVTPDGKFSIDEVDGAPAKSISATTIEDDEVEEEDIDEDIEDEFDSLDYLEEGEEM